MKSKIAIVLILLWALSFHVYNQDGGIAAKIFQAGFPEDTLVQTKEKGPLQMKDLKIGDEILATKTDCPESKPFFTKITGWLHKDPELHTEYLQIVDSN